MPVEIKELVIRAVVGQPDDGRRMDQAPGEPGAEPASASTSADRDAIVAAAVKEVLRVLRASKER